MKNFKTKFLIFFLIISVVVGGLALPANQAKAQSVGDVLTVIGGGVGLVGICMAWKEAQDILDKTESTATGALESGLSFFSKAKMPVEDTEARQEQAEQNCLTKMGNYLLSNLKQRLLDRLTQQTVEWIQGGGQPRFIDDPGGFFQDAADSAVGDTINEVEGLDTLCSSSLKTQIILDLEDPTFEDNVSCTLTEALGNVEATIEQFENDFRNGGWIAYNETVKPQNNLWGVRAMTQNKIAKDRAQEEQQAQYQATAGNGFLSQKRCLQWENTSNGETINKGESNFSPDQTPDGQTYNGTTNRPSGSSWICSESQVVTPGSVAAEALNQTVGSGFSRIINANDLTNFVTAVTNAMVNELTRNVIDGDTPGVLQGFQNDDGEVEMTDSDDASCDDLDDPDLQQNCETKQETSENYDPKDTIIDALNSAEESLVGARNSIANAKSRNEEAIETLEDLQQCQEATGNIENSNVGSTIETAEDRKPDINTLESTIDELIERVNQTLSEVQNMSAQEAATQTGQINQLLTEADNAVGNTNNIASQIEGALSSAEEDLNACEEGDSESSTSTDSSTSIDISVGESHTLSVGEEHEHEGGFATSTGSELDSYIWNFVSCPSESCPSISDSFQIISGTSTEIGGPTFTPNEAGEYQIKLEVSTEDNTSSSTLIEIAE